MAVIGRYDRPEMYHGTGTQAGETEGGTLEPLTFQGPALLSEIPGIIISRYFCLRFPGTCKKTGKQIFFL